jgi:hypothetical protein
MLLPRPLLLEVKLPQRAKLRLPYKITLLLSLRT